MIRKDKKLSMRRQCELLELNRSMIYYQPKEESDENLYVMQMIDKRHLNHPTHGVLQMQDYLFTLGRYGSIWVSNGKFTDLNDSTSFPASVFAIQKVVLKPLPK